MTVVSVNNINLDKARIIAEQKVGAEFRIRPYF
jgi:hypothetical protein